MTEDKIKSTIKETPSTLFQHKFWQTEEKTRNFNHPVVEFFAKQRIEFISKYLPLNKIKSVLDVGSGQGFSGAYLPQENSITATDFSFSQLKKNPIKNRIVSTSENLPFKEKSFSLVTEWELLHHLPDPIKAVKEMSRITKDYLIFFEPNRQNPGLFCFALLKKEERDVLRYHKKMMYKFAEHIDFDIITCQTVGFVFPNRMPEFILPLAKKIPFQLPVIGLSNVLICKRKRN